LRHQKWVAVFTACVLGAASFLVAAQVAETQKSSKKAASKKGRRSSSKKSKRGWRSGQQAPSADRYKQIQEVLATRGYLQGSPTGVWDQNSQDALKKFQQEQNLKPTGKIDSLSLIALGLGPKRETPVQPAPPAPR
jgi:peptidoglycan hydrolase-like protein with peptidoglycan-binding domain